MTKKQGLGEFRADLVLRRDEAGAIHVLRTLHSDKPLTEAQWTRLSEIVDRWLATIAMRNGAEILGV